MAVKEKVVVVGVPKECVPRFYTYASEMDFDADVNFVSTPLTSSTFSLTISSKEETPKEKWELDIEPFLKSYFSGLVYNRG